MGTDLREEINNSAELCQLRPVGSPAGVESLVWRRAVQERIEGHLMAVEALMSALDSMDSDPDLEPDSDYELQGDEEYSLGWTCKEVSTGRYVSKVTMAVIWNTSTMVWNPIAIKKATEITRRITAVSRSNFHTARVEVSQ